MFDKIDVEKKDEKIKPTDLMQPNNPICGLILYIFSMDTFIYEALKEAALNEDTSKVQNLGAFAWVLSYIIYYVSRNRNDMDDLTKKMEAGVELFRGTGLT